MSASMAPVSGFLMVDAALAGFGNRDMSNSPAGTPSWMVPLYAGAAAWAGPVLIDILAAESSGALDQAMSIVNATTPHLHLSFIDTQLDIDELAVHLRRFIFVVNEEHQPFSMRFADCLVLAALPEVFSSAQWVAFAGPVSRWSVHRRDGTLVTLAPVTRAVVPESTPLRVTEQQIDHLRDIFAPDRMISHLRDLGHGVIAGSALEQHRWASASYALWKTSGSKEEVIWRWLTEAVFETRGAALTDAELKAVIVEESLEATRTRLRAVTTRHEIK